MAGMLLMGMYWYVFRGDDFLLGIFLLEEAMLTPN